MKDWKYINGAEVGNQDGVARMFEGLVKDEKKETEKDSGAIKDLEKVGNASTGDFVALINRALKIAKEKPEKASRMNQIVSFLKSAHNLPGDRWQYHIDRISKELDEVGNKVGNSAYEDGAKKGREDKRKGKLITAGGFEMHAPGYTNLSFKEKEEYRKGYYSTNDLTKDDVYKWGNSASDDKFAYVMREFDKGKLKSSSGETVTNPEQAKAIAYSESKKAENGLDRAWEAMKDKH